MVASTSRAFQRISQSFQSEIMEEPKVTSADPTSLNELDELPVRKSIEDQVYEYLRTLIVSGLTPGTPLRLDEVARRLNVSTMPVRGALARLGAENLTTQLGRHRTVVVAPLSIEDLKDIQAIRCGVEGYAARIGAAEIPDKDLDLMTQSYDQLSMIVAEEPETAVEDYLRVQFASRHLCYRAAGHPRLLQTIEQWRRAAERYIRLAADVETMLAKDLDFEAEFLDACRARDGGRAETAVRSMLLAVVSEFEVWLRRQPASL